MDGNGNTSETILVSMRLLGPVFVDQERATALPVSQPVAIPNLFSFSLRMQRTRAESRPYVAPVGCVEVPISVMNETGAGCPTTTPKHLVVPKPGRGILFIRTGNKAGIWLEVACGPFP